MPGFRQGNVVVTGAGMRDGPDFGSCRCVIFFLKHKKKSEVQCISLFLCEMAEQKGLEPSASGVTGRRYNRLNYCSVVAAA